MILRKLAAAIREQNWFTVLLEIIIVVVGIFLGLQVDGWNQSRTDRKLEQAYLERLHADAKMAVDQQREFRRWNNARLRTEEVVLEALRSGVLLEDHRVDFQEGLALSGSLNPLIWQWGVVQELYSTGNIGLIRDSSLRDLIARTEVGYRRRREIIRVATSEITILRGQIARQFDPIIYGYGNSPSEEVKVEYDFEALSADSEFIAAFSNLHLQTARVVTFTEDHLRTLERLEAGIAEARGIDSMASMQ